MNRFESRGRIEDELEGLGRDDAIEDARGNRGVCREIGHDRGPGIPGMDMKSVATHDSVRSEAPRVGVIADFENTTLDALGIGQKESLDVEAIHRGTAVETEISADGFRTPQTAPINAHFFYIARC